MALRDDLPSIGTVFRESGYHTGYIGKWHLEGNRDDYVPPSRRFGFDYWAVRNCAHEYHNSYYCDSPSDKIPLRGYEPIAQTELAINFIRNRANHPFCLTLSWGPPHNPYTAPDEFMDEIDPLTLTPRPNVGIFTEATKLLNSDKSPLTTDQARKRTKVRELLQNQDLLKKRWLHGYQAATNALDSCVGRLLDLLDEMHIADNTIVLFTSDHGDMLGSHGMASKQMPFEESISIPLIVRYPSQIKHRSIHGGLVEHVDLLPTLTSLSEIKCPPVDGISQLGPRTIDKREAVLLMKMKHGGRPWLANGVTPWRGIRTSTHTYARLLDRGPWLLFDNVNDPFQLNNLIGQARHHNIQRELEDKMMEMINLRGDSDTPPPICGAEDVDE